MRVIQILIVVGLLGIIGCKDAPERPGAILDENYEPIVPTNTPAATTPPATAEPPQNAAGVWHYTCPSGCAGGAGSAVPCATCGTTLVHNTAYHNNNGAAATTPTPSPVTTQTTSPSGSPVGSITNPKISGIQQQQPAAQITPPVGAPQKPPEPAQNAAGVWHYICNAGCAGGAGSAVACAGCGATLVHNTAYHN